MCCATGCSTEPSAAAAVSTSLDQLLRQQRVWRGNHVADAAAGALPTGYPRLDARLPGGGWPRAALVELLVERHGIGELGLLMPVLARLSAAASVDGAHAGTPAAAQGTPRWLCWVAPPLLPYAPALAAQGIALERVLLVHPPTGGAAGRNAGHDSGYESGHDALWAAEQALVSRHCAVVLVWSAHARTQALRRLQLAAEAADTLVVVFRPPAAAAQRSPALLRLQLDGDGTLHVLKGRGMRPQRLSLAALGIRAEEDRCPER